VDEVAKRGLDDDEGFVALGGESNCVRRSLRTRFVSRMASASDSRWFFWSSLRGICHYLAATGGGAAVSEVNGNCCFEDIIES
jgi:hypothetical protein